MSTNQITGNVGLYLTCYKLSKLGWNAMPTARNARGIDIVAYDRTASRFVVGKKGDSSGTVPYSVVGQSPLFPTLSIFFNRLF
jgi:hypothetical protein